jgi:uncharacterized membrane protein YkvA (DUF1232 family)
MTGPSLAHRLRVEAHAVLLAVRDPRTPWGARAVGLLVAAYALSPIDLIPDFIPILGYLDELILLPLAILGLVRLIDPAVMAEHRRTAEALANQPVSRSGALLIGTIWVVAAAALLWLFWPGRAA